MVNILVIGFALALDAFAVAMGLGCGNRLRLKEKSLIILSFGFFQSLLTFLGAELGNYINANLFNITNYLSGIIIIIIGILFLKEGHYNDEACVYKKFNLWTYIVLGISVSIDAFGVGFSILYGGSMAYILTSAIIVGVITSFLTWASFYIVNYVKNFSLVEKYAAYLGGSILCFLGLVLII
ncbi:manganese efflux pump MntP family protein [Halonatronum saccharophilum]|uniref:manganese efflux pump MntP n=1 Tax=Halonatronum saccharophilum TaxID=150060 RepID=UPI0004B8AA36|nr:manganese efflux pump [Halonatronum saccharophilum]